MSAEQSQEQSQEQCQAGLGEDVTALLGAYRSGDERSGDALIEAVYPELRRIARRMLGRLRSGETLDTTALVHEAYLKFEGKDIGYHDRVHFYSLCARAMRQILIDHARAHASQKRGGNVIKVPLEEELLKNGPGGARAFAQQAGSLVALDDALCRLGAIDARLVRVVECRFFGGMSEKEIGEALDMSVSTVQRSWVKARVWLQDSLTA